MASPKRAWDLWTAIALLGLLVVGEMYSLFDFLIPRPGFLPSEVVFELVAWKIGFSLGFIFLIAGLCVRWNWVWWVAVVGLSALVLWGVATLASYLREAGDQGWLTPPVLFAMILPQGGLAGVVAMLVVSRLRGTYDRRGRGTRWEENS